MPLPCDFVGPILPFPFVKGTFWRKRKPAIYRLMIGPWGAELFHRVFSEDQREVLEEVVPLEELLKELEGDKDEEDQPRSKKICVH